MSISPIINLVEKNITISGSISLTTLGLAKIFTILGLFLQYACGTVGIIVGLITIYAFLEKKGLLPKRFIIKDKK